MSVHEEIPLQPDRVPNRLVFWVFAGTIISIIGCVFVVWLIGGHTLTGDGATRTTVELRQIPPAIPFEDTLPMETLRTAQQMELTHWTWADRSKGIARMPVAKAIDLYLQQRGSK